MLPSERSRRNTSSDELWSPLTRSFARLVKVTKRPSPALAGSWLRFGTCVPSARTLSRDVWPELVPASDANTSAPETPNETARDDADMAASPRDGEAGHCRGTGRSRQGSRPAGRRDLARAG